jgi:hypothetical protein
MPNAQLESAEQLLQSPMQFVRDKDSFDHACRIQKNYGVLEEILAWSKESLTAEWRWQLVSVSSDIRPGDYIFYFDSERDYLAFVMKWL